MKEKDAANSRNWRRPRTIATVSGAKCTSGESWAFAFSSLRWERSGWKLRHPQKASILRAKGVFACRERIKTKNGVDDGWRGEGERERLHQAVETLEGALDDGAVQQMGCGTG